MADTQKGPRAPRSTQTSAGRANAEPASVELLRAKRALTSARARGEDGALTHTLAAYPRHTTALIAFDAALLATSSYENEALTAETTHIAERALARALAAVFPAAPVAQAALSLKALRQARRIPMPEAARQLGLGVDVLSYLEAGRIAASTVPERLVRALGNLLGTAAEQIGAALQGQAALTPALQRSRGGARKTPPAAPATTPLAFADAVRTSPGMTPEQKATWLAEER
ncbi:MAG: hypothetical protein IVW57_09370 [Ktedonobacterales bacterium]|nr:hypothetical protein [Ktedonobacterales bacterium]